MHSPEIRQKFIERRADAHSIPKISSLLGVAQSTLRLWETTPSKSPICAAAITGVRRQQPRPGRRR
jgi:hypothetical protein